MDKQLYRRTYILVIIVLIQFTASMMSVNETLLYKMDYVLPVYKYPYLIELLIHILGISSIVWIIYILNSFKQELKFSKQLNSSDEIIEALKGQKHDFNNHMNMVSVYIQMNQTDRAADYINEVCGKSNEVFSISKIENAEIAAIIYKKYAIAESKGITVDLDITSTLDGLSISPVDLSKILFNLIDNAIYELEHSCSCEKILSIEIYEFEGQHIISVGNSSPVLSPELCEKIWVKGFSTKRNSRGDHGYGLSIVKHAVEKNGGKIEVESYDSIGTIFTVFLPKNGR
ncbi:sensor histidine kinase [Peptoclostridium litorale]|uniref:sensor histidine kinase n=1 Tax=Peptoclostridium litorale TaxID=1557 RepID=UPI0013565D79|nr:ATP-binding protein [Peptoclostridium litorale]